MRLDAPEAREAHIQKAAIPVDAAHVHFIGIGGSGMAEAALLLRRMGSQVSGSDLEPFDIEGRIASEGVALHVGHDAAYLPQESELVVASAAIPQSNPELMAARRRGLPVCTYPQLVGRLMSAHKGVAIAGTHGKSTTTAMTAHLFRGAGLDPTFILGACCDQLGGGSGVGRGAHFIAEACEFGRSFLSLRPSLAAVLNIESDHLDWYRDIKDIFAAFRDFCSQVEEGGTIVCCGDDVLASRAAKASGRRVVTFGFGADCDWRAVNLSPQLGCFRFDLCHRGTVVGTTTLSIPGQHNVANALAATALARAANVPISLIESGLASFAGVDRRMSVRYRRQGVTVIDDYAHHPTEVRVTIEAARGQFAPKRSWVVFQPHQYSRTRHFLDDFARSFKGADKVIIPDVYCAREKRDGYGADGARAMVERIGHYGVQAEYVASLEAVTEHLAGTVTAGDMVLVMGAGDVWKVANELARRLRA